ncbi:MAG: hypothetical protein MUE98_00285 [Rhodobacteraceae bacterium]|jgi:DNA-binding NarL/FixJ family response regulator|nr:hypothetical protein [Paracoccaceae bacterium]
MSFDAETGISAARNLRVTGAMLREAAAAGRSLSDAARGWGVHVQTVRDAEVRFGVTLARRRGGRDPMDVDRVRALFEAGASDVAIAADQGVARQSVGRLRRELGLRRPAAEPAGAKTSEVLRLAAEGVPNAEIARRVGLTLNSVKMRLAVRGGLTREVLLDAAARGLTQADLARERCVSPASVSQAVRRHEVTLARPGKLCDVSDREILRLLDSGLSLRAIGGQLGVHHESVRNRIERIPVRQREAILRELRAGRGSVLRGRPGAGAAQGEAAAPEAGPAHPFWTAERDALVLKSAGSYAGLRSVAELLGQPFPRVQQRWHRLRAG